MKDSSENFSSILPQSTSPNAEEMQEFQKELWLLLAQKTQRYTMGDSTSVPIEIAQDLLQSICFCIALAQKASKSALAPLKNPPVQELFEQGFAEVERQIARCNELLKSAAASMLPVRNGFYQAVLPQAERFLKKYDYRFFAHTVPVTLDYPLAHPVREQQGVSYLNDYLSRLVLENDFCGRFPPDALLALLNAYAPHFSSQFANIYELVANQALALTLLHQDRYELDVRKEDGVRLAEHLAALSAEDAHAELDEAVDVLSRQLGLTDAPAVDYLRESASALLERLKANRFARVFYARYDTHDEAPAKIHYADGTAMDDSALRELIAEIGTCTQAADKISIVKQDIHSLADLTEVLNVCFWGDECAELFATLEEPALAVLLHFVQESQRAVPPRQADSGWEALLLQYVDQLKEVQRRRIERAAQKIE